MRAPSEIRRVELITRLAIAAVLNVGLLSLYPGVAREGNLDRECLNVLVASSIGAAAVVCVAPLLWRGKTWEPVAALLLMLFPAFSLLLALAFYLKNR